jgi:protein SCO1/2
MRRLAAIVLVPVLGAAAAQPLVPVPRVPAVAFAPRAGTALPAGLAFVDADGRALRLGDEFRGRPVLLALGYYRCPQLCGLLAQGVLEALHDAGLPADAARIVFASIDPQDTPADAAARRRVDLAYARFLDPGAPAPALDLLVGPPASVAALAQAIGFTWRPGDAAARFAHPAGIVVITPDGRVSRLLPGVRYDAGELRAALVEAGGGRIGTTVERLALLCAHVDGAAGSRTPAVLAGLRIAGLATLLALALLLARHRRRPA